jgi:exodeoxyribonuclease VII large subunit
MSEPFILSVSELNTRAKNTLESQLGQVAVSGEISNLVQASSGHYYFSLKDSKAQVRCAFFSGQQRKSSVTLRNGQEIIASGKVSLYEPRGDYQLIVSQIQDTGLGLLYQQFIELKNKLSQLGLFEETRKKTIPIYPNHIAIITSPKGAALHDIMTTIQRRFPMVKTTLFPSEVQGPSAHLQLIAALEKAQVDKTIDCIILARGGGSLEDLWSFNQEALALAIVDCKIPVISGVGHETDFTIADFVADYRAATPTAAAEKATPNQEDLQIHLKQWQARLVYLMSQSFSNKQKTLNWLQKRFTSPDKILFQPWQRLDFANRLLKELCLQKNIQFSHRLALLQKRLDKEHPSNRLRLNQQRLTHFNQQLLQSINRILDKKRFDLKILSQTLHTLGPQATLQRGYAIAMHQNKVLTQAKDALPGEEIQITLSQGRIISIAKDIIDG